MVGGKVPASKGGRGRQDEREDWKKNYDSSLVRRRVRKVGTGHARRK